MRLTPQLYFWYQSPTYFVNLYELLRHELTLTSSELVPLFIAQKISTDKNELNSWRSEQLNIQKISDTNWLVQAVPEHWNFLPYQVFLQEWLEEKLTDERLWKILEQECWDPSLALALLSSKPTDYWLKHHILTLCSPSWDQSLIKLCLRPVDAE
jgi:hypothetical protein